MSRNVAVIGAGHSKWGSRPDVNLAELSWESIKPALEEAGVENKDIDFFSIGYAGGWSSEQLIFSVIAEYCNLRPKGSMRVESACASGSAAIKVGRDTVASGQSEIALVLGLEKMRESPTPVQVELIGRAGNYFWEFENFGLTFPGYYAAHATAYMDKYGATEEDLAEVAVKNHSYAAKNPKAQFQKEISIEEVMNSPYIAWPNKLYDCCPLSDGSAALILASEDVAKDYTDDPVWIAGQGTATGTASLMGRKSYTSLEAAVEARKKAYKEAGINPENPADQIDVAEVHDCFTIAEIMAYEDLGFAEKGEGYKYPTEGETYIGGKIPVNISGGLKAKGHPIAATGVSQAYEMVKQLHQERKKGRQAEIKNGVGLNHNIGGTGHSGYVTIWSLQKPS